MSKLDDLAQNIGDLANEIDTTTTATTNAAQEAQDAISAADALGAEDVALGMTQVKTDLENLANTLQGASAQATQIQTLTQDIAGGG